MKAARQHPQPATSVACVICGAVVTYLPGRPRKTCRPPALCGRVLAQQVAYANRHNGGRR